MLRKSDTIQDVEKESYEKRRLINKRIKKVIEGSKQHVKDDPTKMGTRQSQKLMTKEDVKKLYPGFKEENIDFYLKILMQYMKINLGILGKQQLNRIRTLEELDRA